MPAENPPGHPFPANQDPDRTVHYRTPQPTYGQPYGQPEGDQPTRVAYPGSGQDDPTRMQYPSQQPQYDQQYGQQYQQQPQYGDQTRVDYPSQQQYGQQPQYGQQWQQPEELAYGLPPVQLGPEPKRGGIGRGWIIALIAAVLAGVVGGGGFYLVNALSGGGTQPHEVLPGSAFAYVRLDLDPAANQKLALFTIARKFNATKDVFSADDPRKVLFDTLAESSPDFKNVDYAKDVEPWLGSRVGLAFSQTAKPDGGDEPLGVAVAIQTSDESATRAFIEKMDGDSQDKTGYVFRDGYVILAQSQKEADKYADAPTLAQNPDFSGDMAALGEPGVLSFWASAKSVLESGLPTGVDQALVDRIKDGRFAGALRFDGDYAEIAGISRGIDTTVAGDVEASRIGELPDSTAAALSVSGMGDMLSKQWTEILEATNAAGPEGQSFNQFLNQAQQQFGLTLPDDLAVLLGKNLTVAVDENGLDGDLPNIGTVLSTDPAKAQAVLEKLELAFANSGAPVQLIKKAGDGKLVVATTEEYAGKLAATGTLKDSETFQLAVPNAEDSAFALYADLDKIEKLYLNSLSGEERANLEALRAVGMSAQYSGSEVGFNLRLIFN
ncbi:hypothetical protein Aph01nite_53470 [Acrocarpospora phusangensis]|uniref:DUF3352 domain-containing protein n=1 Tax=Acrocarpospora phusangensis TaxID=1070424 RepID=A0A919QDN7_9ACTN|nr:DUF3352 domain-containing protein [Acrocarpospora phusangensis]GIH27037.1 hypothetical protein Aph01nite_53470 [Acrocarpospora phusangensis]